MVIFQIFKTERELCSVAGSQIKCIGHLAIYEFRKSPVNLLCLVCKQLEKLSEFTKFSIVWKNVKKPVELQAFTISTSNCPPQLSYQMDTFALQAWL